MKILSILALAMILSACVMEQSAKPRGPGSTMPQTAFHPTLYTSPGAVGGVSKSTYTITELNR